MSFIEGAEGRVNPAPQGLNGTGRECPYCGAVTFSEIGPRDCARCGARGVIARSDPSRKGSDADQAAGGRAAPASDLFDGSVRVSAPDGDRGVFCPESAPAAASVNYPGAVITDMHERPSR